MNKFMTDDFMLDNEYAKTLYHNYAKDVPIFDFHCHLEAKEIYENENIPSITKAWLGGDHYKWRVMRACGVEEKYITGDADDFEKFEKYAEIMPYLIGNPIYHWTHLELKNYFGIDYPLNKENAKEVYDKCNELLAKDEYRPQGLIKMSNVAAVCTTNDPTDTLEYHKKLEKEDLGFVVKPAFRPDNAIYIEKDSFNSYLNNLSDVSGIKITDFTSLKKALIQRIKFFNENGCKASDQAFQYIPYRRANEDEVNEIVRRKISGVEVSKEEEEKFKTEILLFLAGEYKKLDWAMEIHVGVIRNNSKKMFEALGADVGGDSQSDLAFSENLANILSDIEEAEGMPRTIIFPLNPKDQYPIMTIAGSFNRANEEKISTVQLGTAWWHLDHKEGMIDQMKIFSQVGVLSKFVGMLTDSRSFLSYPRHEYFRRILCNFIGGFVERGEYPWDEKFLGQVVEDICINNAKKFIKVDFK
ncbi:glucuronate isomerase [Anaerococcus sp. AGMB00486]|uniref:Uronate isomerase n=2 Tax=Anaerococcus TaxID=165779 RepID=A0ABX2NCD9_9FIRM|nr:MULTISPECIES: glucuronate isomerase [Anaerococcus]MSS78425.1 glucuronate isomerase [Anaerococcus porci]NVF12399.1 glucuronate isomerase [Anaerococcus faecalis]